MTLKMSSADMVAAARARIREIETPDLMAMLKDPDVVVVDLRDIRERQRSGYIPGSFHAPRGMIEFRADPNKEEMYNPIFEKDAEIYLICGAGGQAAPSGKTLHDMGYTNVTNIGGFPGWKDAGGPTES